MKVSPEYIIQLSHRVNTLHREKEKFIESPGEKDKKVVESPSEKGQGNIVNPGQRTGSIFLCVQLTGPGQRIGRTTIETSC